MMPLSARSRAVLDAAVRLNPEGAKLLLLSLVSAPRAVRYTATDNLGPLGHMVRTGDPRGDAPAPSGLLARPALPPSLAEAAAAFTEEWLDRRFSKAELAEAIRSCLEDLGVAVEHRDAGWQTLASRGDASDLTLDHYFPPPDRA